MNIIFSHKLKCFYEIHPQSKNLLLSWNKRIKNITPRHFVELKKSFQQADQVGEFTVFNIGNNYRLIARIEYESQRVIIREVLTHQDYDRGKWKK